MSTCHAVDAAEGRPCPSIGTCCNPATYGPGIPGPPGVVVTTAWVSPETKASAARSDSMSIIEGANSSTCWPST